jgi:aerobic carbon-monoxide dehydrogenase small subunit
MRMISLSINGERVEAHVEPRTSLADFLRISRGLTGTHLGCEHGVCGACTVTIDGSPARSCITYAVQMDDREIRTIEGYDEDDVMSALRTEFSKEHALQCGFCTPGMLITARDIVTRLGDPGEARVREELAGNLCRCTGYAGIVQAVQNVGSASRQTTTPIASAPKVRATPALAIAERDLVSKRADPILAEGLGGGATVIEDTIVIDAPSDRVWSFFHDLPAVAACLPGAELSKHDAQNWEGTIRIKMGPVRAHLSGQGRYRLVEEEKTGRVEGSGGDRLSGSRVNGALAFASSEAGPAATRLKLSLSYVLQGPLAQFSRSSLAKEFVKLVVEEFGRNVAARLSGSLPVVPSRASDLGIGRLLQMLIAAFWRQRR